MKNESIKNHRCERNLNSCPESSSFKKNEKDVAAESEMKCVYTLRWSMLVQDIFHFKLESSYTM